MSKRRIFGRMTRERELWAFVALTVVVVFVLGVSGYVLFGNGTQSSKAPHAIAVAEGRNAVLVSEGDKDLLVSATAAAHEESGGLCNRAVTRARAYGVLPANSRNKATKVATETAGRYVCKAEADAGKIYILAVDQRCDDLDDHACFVLHKVSNPVGQPLFERQI